MPPRGVGERGGSDTWSAWAPQGQREPALGPRNVSASHFSPKASPGTGSHLETQLHTQPLEVVTGCHLRSLPPTKTMQAGLPHPCPCALRLPASVSTPVQLEGLPQLASEVVLFN